MHLVPNSLIPLFAPCPLTPTGYRFWFLWEAAEGRDAGEGQGRTAGEQWPRRRDLFSPQLGLPTLHCPVMEKRPLWLISYNTYGTPQTS